MSTINADAPAHDRPRADQRVHLCRASIKITQAKKTMLQARLQRRLRTLDMTSYGQYPSPSTPQFPEAPLSRKAAPGYLPAPPLWRRARLARGHHLFIQTQTFTLCRRREILAPPEGIELLRVHPGKGADRFGDLLTLPLVLNRVADALLPLNRQSGHRLRTEL